MALKEHLRELRNRLVKAAVAVVLGTVGGFFLYLPVFEALTRPLIDAGNSDGRFTTINFEGVATPFDQMIQVSVFIGLLVSSPVWLYQAWAFVTPGLKTKERRAALGFLAAAVPLFLAGVGLAWLILPNAVRVLTEFTPEGGSNVITASVYLAFVLRLLLAFGIAFLIPVFLVGLNLAGLLTGKTVLKYWRITVFVICLFAAMAAPGADALSMFYLAAPLLLLFAVAVGICLINDKRRIRRQASREAAVAADVNTATPVHEL
ncbi:twin-arginine translocase subunit TatC [Arthrobacter zhangbolii]|uniref:Sec-independent protein translocase protein TatC n=1 Tax=Arthrobacter zhangbolii TaxID=2886936 RepID=A0A9X1S8J2_9MICC|nr:MULTISPECIES: twin-arginine translocase subunit TatC [Arthrobacter]MCC3271466.1 twin-arginine translocase subunit TatC [Arthrobacter zhangbolii]MCC3293375.1 twin-arginine translocase subunit TatC [Arthrobacter zhangbolii]MDN3904537.1 twin-arginine translocase subunit TatC [Arthrobacter sp. YD2]UON90762.1 twin-arginine translocase subunit TatC [Arthrobacter zhangbolii]